MKIKVKVEEKKVIVLDKNDEEIFAWGKAAIEEMGGLDKCIERCKKNYPKLEIEVIGSDTPATTAAPTTAAPTTTAAPAVK